MPLLPSARKRKVTQFSSIIVNDAFSIMTFLIYFPHRQCFYWVFMKKYESSLWYFVYLHCSMRHRMSPRLQIRKSKAHASDESIAHPTSRTLNPNRDGIMKTKYWKKNFPKSVRLRAAELHKNLHIYPFFGCFLPFPSFSSRPPLSTPNEKKNKLKWESESKRGKGKEMIIKQNVYDLDSVRLESSVVYVWHGKGWHSQVLCFASPFPPPSPLLAIQTRPCTDENRISMENFLALRRSIFFLCLKKFCFATAAFSERSFRRRKKK